MGTVESARYEIRIRGRLGAPLRNAFDDLDVTDVPAETVLSGIVADQAALRGLLDRIQLYGLELVEVRRCRHATASGPAAAGREAAGGRWAGEV